VILGVGKREKKGSLGINCLSSIIDTHHTIKKGWGDASNDLVE